MWYGRVGSEMCIRDRATAILATGDAAIRERYLAYRQAQTEKALADDDLVMP